MATPKSGIDADAKVDRSKLRIAVLHILVNALKMSTTAE
jgi:hypothetical protein